MNKKHLKIILYLGITIAGGFSGAFLDKYNLKDKIITFRHEVYNFFSREPVKTTYTANDNENIIARYFSESDTAKKENPYKNIEQVSPVKTLPQVTDYCHGYLKYGNPSYNANSTLGESNLYICRDGYVVGYNYQTKEASWVAFNLTKSKLEYKHKRNDKFKEDYDVPYVYRATLSDYKGRGYDRGHLASYASMDFSNQSAEQSFLLSNMSPQKAGLNRQGWERLERDERIWANMYDNIYVYTGPIYKKQKINKTIGDNKIAVPDYFYKIIYVPSKNKAIAFVMPNARVDKTSIDKYRTSIKDIESRTGLNFLPNINDRDNIINNVSSMWRTSYI